MRLAENIQALAINELRRQLAALTPRTTVQPSASTAQEGILHEDTIQKATS